ncbi:DUF6907 domain-containing protein [Actinoplanes sp. CA-142083]|uniref:DUF6907 domain-containing protein n=1 Tax=Actinoplanes sp. CA-142083 TaxID=3239903 RepID=UPI003D8C39AD
MAVIESDTLSTDQKTPECPWWCTANHGAPLTADNEQHYQRRAHDGRERSLPGVIDELGEAQSAAVALVQVDSLSTGERGPVGVAAICEGVLTPKQAEQFARMVLHAAAEARQANAGGLVPTSAELRGAGA